MKAPRILTRARAYVRAGYPAAAPRHGYVAALALLPPTTRSAGR
ncbi:MULTISPECIES: DUF3349 domain-containing protein [Mycobacteriaceae]|nr:MULTISPECIES: DUF3349 domain-containing protein [Mycobacteriaceae]